MEQMLVRLKPYDPAKGHVKRRYSQPGWRFDEGRGWYKVPADVAEQLREVRQVENRPYSPPAFDVCTKEEALELERREKIDARRKRGANDALSVEEAENGLIGELVSDDEDLDLDPPVPRRTATLTTADIPKPTPTPRKKQTSPVKAEPKKKPATKTGGRAKTRKK